MKSVTWERLDELLTYCESDGKLTWKKRPWKKGGNFSGKIAGTTTTPTTDKNKSYVRVVIDGHNYPAHVIIWFLKTKEWRLRGLDHIDGDGTNNRWDNLRICDGRHNNGNQTRRSDNTTGYKGVSFRKACSQRPYYAQINIGGKQKVIGYYATAAEAGAAYDNAAREIFGDFALTNSQVGG